MSQPLNVGKKEKEGKEPIQSLNEMLSPVDIDGLLQIANEEMKAILDDIRPIQSKEAMKTEDRRRRLPDDRNARIHKFNIAGIEGYVSVGMYEDGGIGEIFIKMDKEGSTVSGFADCFATALSIGLQYGVPLEAFVNKFKRVAFKPNGWSQHADIKYAASIVDYIARWLETEFIAKPSLPVLEHKSVKSSSVVEIETKNNERRIERQTETMSAGPACHFCGSSTQRAGSCYICINCSTTTGCS